MTNKVKQIIEEIESGKRNSIYGINFTLEEYLSKGLNGTTFLEYLLQKKYIFMKQKYLKIH